MHLISRMTAWSPRFEKHLQESVTKQEICNCWCSTCPKIFGIDTCNKLCSHCPSPPPPPTTLSTLAPPLTVQNILTAVQGVAWKQLGEGLIPHGDYNHESRQFDYLKLDEIAQQHQSNDSRLRAVIECWLQGEKLDKEPSWRRIIWVLDGINANRSADTIRHSAEHLPGKAVTPSHSCTVSKCCPTSDSAHTMCDEIFCV